MNGVRLEEMTKMAQGCVSTLDGRIANPSHSQIVNPKGEMKGSAITGPVGKEAAELWPVQSLVVETHVQC